MTPRRLAALQALAERGATEGERAAARNALDAYRNGQSQQKTQRKPFSRDEYARFLNDLFRRESETFAQQYEVLFSRPPHRSQNSERWRPQPPKPATPESRVTQMRRATAADFPDLPMATADPSNRVVLRVEFATAAQMWDRFNSEQPWRVLWQGFVWDAPKPCGTLHDRAKQRVYVKIDGRQLREVTLPV